MSVHFEEKEFRLKGPTLLNSTMYILLVRPLIKSKIDAMNGL